MADSERVPFVQKSTSSLNKQRAVLEWTVEDMELIRYKTTPVYSDRLPLKDLGFPDATESWMLALQALEKNEDQKGERKWLGLFLVLVDMRKDTDVCSQFTLHARLASGKGWAELVTDRPNPNKSFVFKNDDVYFTVYGEAISHSDLSKYLVDGAVTVRADIDFMMEHKNRMTLRTNIRNVSSGLSVGFSAQNTHLGHIAQLYRDKIYTDFLLVSSDNRKFCVHRSIIATRSPVLSAMLEHGQVEKDSSRCDIPDVDGEILDVLLQFLYGCSTDRVNSNNAEKVMEAADKYQVIDLRDVAVEHLISTITVDNAARLLISADRRSLGALEGATTLFVARNLEEFLLAKGLQVDEYSKDLREKLWDAVGKRRMDDS